MIEIGDIMNYVYEERRISLQDHDTLVGEVTWEEKDNTLYIQHTYVNPQYRGKGIASSLIEALVKQLEEQKKSCIPTRLLKKYTKIIVNYISSLFILIYYI